MKIAETAFQNDIPGVFAARQIRSKKNRDEFIQQGIDALNSIHFDDLKISDLASASGISVGSFYTRFKDKHAFFHALRIYSVDAINREITKDFTVAALKELTPGEALDRLVDLMGAIFSSRYRGVMRETWPLIIDDEDHWAPFRNHARSILQTVHEGLQDAFPTESGEQTRTRLSFCFQMIVGVLQNDLVNDYHVFKLSDGTILPGLKDAVRSYMGLPRFSES